MQSYVINKTMQDVYFPEARLYDGKANAEWTLEELMQRHIATYADYLQIYKTLTAVIKGGANFTFITISISDDSKLKKFVEKVAWFVKRKYVDKHFYSFEQRSKPDDKKEYGVHVHIIASYRKMIVLNQFEKNVHTTFSAYATDAAIYMNFIMDEYIEDKVNYLNGDKWSDHKQLLVTQDVVWRNKNSLQDYYTNDFNFFIKDGKGVPHQSKSLHKKRKSGEEDCESDRKNC